MNSLTLSVRTIRFYQTPMGKSPVEEFLDSVPDQHAQKVVWVLRLVEREDVIPQQYFKKLSGTGDLWEVRVQIRGNSYRFLGFFDGPALLILTSGFAKKQQKIPLREIELAQNRRTDYFQRRTNS
ncbi:MAG: type II toxin-antitoxin system RelE/ParE family toxin [bacterium]